MDKELGKALPYGVYDVGANTGWVSVGTDHDTAAFAVATIRRTGLTVSAELDTSAYPKGIKISDRQMKDLERRVLRRHQIHGEWNYSLIPARSP